MTFFFAGDTSMIIQLGGKPVCPVRGRQQYPDPLPYRNRPFLLRGIVCRIAHPCRNGLLQIRRPADHYHELHSYRGRYVLVFPEFTVFERCHAGLIILHYCCCCCIRSLFHTGALYGPQLTNPFFTIPHSGTLWRNNVRRNGFIGHGTQNPALFLKNECLLFNPCHSSPHPHLQF